MNRWPVILLGGLLMGLVEPSLPAQVSSSCPNQCNQQYNATLKYCSSEYAQNGRKDRHTDCVKNAQTFRNDCLRRCR